MTTNTDQMVPVTATCRACAVTAVAQIPMYALEARYEGALMQDAFPFLAPEIREFFFGIGLCPACWDEMIGGDE